MSTINLNLNILRIEDSQVLRPCCFDHDHQEGGVETRIGRSGQPLPSEVVHGGPCHFCVENHCPRVAVFKKDVKAEPHLTQAGVYTYTYEFNAGEVYGIDAFGWRFQAVDINSNLLVTEQIVGDQKDQIQKTLLITEAGNYDVSISIYTPDGTPTNKPPRKKYT